MSIFEGYMTLRARYYKMKIHLSGAGFSSQPRSAIDEDGQFWGKWDV